MSGTAGLALPADGTQDGTLDLHLTTKDLTLDENSKQNVLYQKFSSGRRRRSTAPSPCPARGRRR